MNIPKESREANTRFDRWVQEQQPDTLALRFFEVSPVQKLMHTVKLGEAGVITKIIADFGAMDPTANGYIHLWLAKIPQDPTIAPATIQAASQIIWEAIGNARFTSNVCDMAPHYIYGDTGESWYLYLVSNIPLGQLFGSINVHLVPTHK